jgi:hypothetical protein
MPPPAFKVPSRPVVNVGILVPSKFDDLPIRLYYLESTVSLSIWAIAKEDDRQENVRQLQYHRSDSEGLRSHTTNEGYEILAAQCFVASIRHTICGRCP